METQNQVVVHNAKQEGEHRLVSVDHASQALSTDLVELAKEVQKADEFVRAGVGAQLHVIVEQMRMLQAQASRVLTEAAAASQLHRVSCNCVKVPGNTYYLYERDSGGVAARFMSMISPQEWGGECPGRFVNGYRLEPDMTWTPLEQLARRSHDQAVVERMISSASGGAGRLPPPLLALDSPLLAPQSSNNGALSS